MTKTPAATNVDVHMAEEKKDRTVMVMGADGILQEILLPPLNMIIIPSTTTKSATIRWLHGLGYSVNEIHKGLGLKYQMVRNIVTTIPKRAAREDLPAPYVEYKPESDELMDALDGALEASLMEGRKARVIAQKKQAAEDRAAGIESEE